MKLPSILLLYLILLTSQYFLSSSANPWKNACSDGQDYDCMEAIGGAFKCRDETKCLTYDSCTEEEALYLSGKFCNSFPYYNFDGSFESNTLKTSSSNFKCLESSESSHPYCLKSESKHSSSHQIKSISTLCTASSSNASYCSIWKVQTDIISKCWREKLPSENFAREFCCDKEESKDHYCCKNDCSSSFYNAKDSISKEEECHCDQESSRSGYCEKWTCRGIENKKKNSNLVKSSLSFWSSQNSTLSESIKTEIHKVEPFTSDFHCSLSDSESSKCLQWEGSYKSISKTILSLCTCSTDDCSSWTCESKSINYIWPNTLWSIFTIVFSLFPLIIFNFIIKKDFDELVIHPKNVAKNFLSFISFFILWGSGFHFIGVWQGGLSVLFISLCVFVPLISLMYCKPLYYSFSSTKPPKISSELPEFYEENLIKVAQADLIEKSYANIADAVYLVSEDEDFDLSISNLGQALPLDLPVALPIECDSQEISYAEIV